MTFLDNLKKETTVGRTANGASTFTSSLNANLDFYAQAAQGLTDNPGERLLPFSFSWAFYLLFFIYYDIINYKVREGEQL